MKKLSQSITYWLGVVAIGLVVGLSLQFVRAWTEPAVAPPGGNVGAPINISDTGQSKAGNLLLNSNGTWANGLIVANGNVGIGTTDPGTKLHVVGAIHSSTDRLYLTGKDTDGNFWINRGWDEGGKFITNPDGDNVIGWNDAPGFEGRNVFIAGNTYIGWTAAPSPTWTKHDLYVSGNVGIGTTAPWARIHISQSDAQGGGVFENATLKSFAMIGGGYNSTWASPYVELRGVTNTTPFIDFLVDPDPYANSWPGSSRDFDARMVYYRTNDSLNLLANNFLVSSRDGNNLHFYVGPSGNIGWASSYLTTDQGGSIELGNKGTPYMDFRNDASSDYDMRLILTGDDILNIDGGNVGIGTNSPGSYKLYVNGNVAAQGYFYASDESLKSNIQSIPNALENVLKLRGVQFQWKENNQPSLGLVAQEVEKVYPELVNTDDQSGLKSVQYANLIAPLIEAIREQQQQINELKNEIEELKK